MNRIVWKVPKKTGLATFNGEHPGCLKNDSIVKSKKQTMYCEDYMFEYCCDQITSVLLFLCWDSKINLAPE